MASVFEQFFEEENSNQEGEKGHSWRVVMTLPTTTNITTKSDSENDENYDSKPNRVNDSNEGYATIISSPQLHLYSVETYLNNSPVV